MSANIHQVYVENPITVNAPGDLMYFGQFPYGVGNDAAMVFSNFSAQFGAPYTPAALTSANDSNVTITLGGSPTNSLLAATSLTMGWNGQLSLGRGGSNASLTASNGGIVWTNASQFQILSGTVTAGQMLQSGATASPTWSTTTWPSTTAINTLLYSSAANTVAALSTANNGVLITSNTGVPSIALTLPNAVQLNITSLGTVTTGTWNAGIIPGQYGGTGVANTGNTITIGGNVTFAGAFTSTFNFTANTNVTFPTSGILATTAQLATYLPLAGGTMTGLLILSGNATNPLGATPLQQVQSLVGAINVIGTANQITVTGSNPSFTLSFPSILHTVNGTILDDGTGNMTVDSNLTIDGLTASMPVLTNSAKKLISSLIDLTTNVTNILPYTNGGTGFGSVGIFQILMGNSDGTGFQLIATPTVDQVLVTSEFAGNEPQWATALPLGIQENIIEVGTLIDGTWNANLIGGQWGGTGVNNGSHTITINGNFQLLGSFTFTGTLTGNTNVTFPTTGTLATTAGLAAYLPLAGGTMTGPLILNADATNPLGAVTLEQLQAVASGFDVKQACYASTTTSLSGAGWTYLNGTSGVGATLTAPSVGVFTTDGTTPPVSSRILVQFETGNTQYQGIYSLTTSSSGAAAVLTRTTDYDTTAQIFPGNLILVDNGTLYMGTGWLQTATVTTIGTSPITFSPFNATNAGTGLTKTGNTISLINPVALNLGGSNAALVANNGGIVWSNASQLQILAGTATAGQMLQSGSTATPSWSTATWPATTAISTLLYSSAANTIAALATANNGVLITSGTGVPSISSTLPAAVQANITSLGTLSSLTVVGTTSINATGAAATTIGNASSSTTMAGPVTINNTGSATMGIGTGSFSGILGIGNASATTNMLGTININTAGSAGTNIGTGTYTGTVTIGGNSIDINANSTGSVFIGNALNTTTIGNTSNLNSIVNIQTGTGSGATNIGTGTYAGTIQIGNTSAALDINAAMNFPTNPTPVTTSGTWIFNQSGIGLGLYSPVIQLYTNHGGTVVLGLAVTPGGNVATLNNILDDTLGGVTLGKVSSVLNIGFLSGLGASATSSPVLINGALALQGSFSYSTGTISSTSSTITGSGTTWTSALTGGVLVVTSGTSKGVTCAVTFVSTTSLTGDNLGPTIPAGSSYIIYYGSHQMSGSSVNLCTSGNQRLFTVGTNSFSGTITLGNTASNAGVISLLTSSSGQVITANNTLDNNGAASFAGLLTLTAGETITGAYNNNLTGSAAINFASSSYSGTMSVGNASSTFNILGTVNIGSSGANTITIGNGGSPSLTQIRGAITLGNADPAANTTIGIADIGTITVVKTVNIGNNTATPSIVNINGVINVNNGTSSAAINIGTSSSYTGTVNVGGNTIAISANSTGAVSIGNNLNSIFIGSQGGANSILNLQSGTGSGGTNICSTAGYTGTLSIGNASMVGFNVNTAGTASGINVSQVIYGTLTSVYGLSIGLTSYSTTYRTAMRFGAGNVSNEWQTGTDSSATKTADFYLYCNSATAFCYKANIKAQFVTQQGFAQAITNLVSPATGNQTITAAQLLDGIVVAPFSGTSVTWTWTTDTGTNIYTALGSPANGTTFQCLWENSNNAAGVNITIAYGSGVTGATRSNTIANNSSALLFFRCTGVNTFTVYS